MSLSSVTATASKLQVMQSSRTTIDNNPTREAFNDFVGQTFFTQLIKSMRQSVGKPPYFHGGRGEEVFQSQLDQLLAERMSDASAEKIADPMFELFSLQRG